MCATAALFTKSESPIGHWLMMMADQLANKMPHTLADTLVHTIADTIVGTNLDGMADEIQWCIASWIQLRIQC